MHAWCICCGYMNLCILMNCSACDYAEENCGNGKLASRIESIGKRIIDSGD
uniref:Uncharacterized protein n=1 Tax=Rhizophora mucronata TaxID=61149 RepID=A0A2P2NMF7_RHIMU